MTLCFKHVDTMDQHGIFSHLTALKSANRFYLTIRQLQSMLKAEPDASGDNKQFLPCLHVASAIPCSDNDDDDE